jgi:vacuolar protein sorting-associated protein VTA1
LINIWGAPDTETQAKIKYAKWNAVRIAKAVKEGKDPNESNPKPEPQPEEEILPELDPNDPEVQGLEGPAKPRQASVEEVPDEQDRVEQKLARQSSIDQSLHPSAQVSARGSPAAFDPYPRDGFPYTAVQDDNVSPLEPSPPNDRNGSVGGGYFPEVPIFTSESSEVPHPTAPPGDVLDLGLPEQPSFNPTKGPEDFESFPPPGLDEPPTASPQDFYQGKGSAWIAPPPNASQPHVHYAPPVQAPRVQPPPQYKSNSPTQQKEQLNTDDAAIAKAQKHARWAISALNFEDAETAVKELRDALKTLGAS